jgi:hypothetical protein
MGTMPLVVRMRRNFNGTLDYLTAILPILLTIYSIVQTLLKGKEMFVIQSILAFQALGDQMRLPFNAKLFLGILNGKQSLLRILYDISHRELFSSLSSGGEVLAS